MQIGHWLRRNFCGPTILLGIVRNSLLNRVIELVGCSLVVLGLVLYLILKFDSLIELEFALGLPIFIGFLPCRIDWRFLFQRVLGSLSKMC